MREKMTWKYYSSRRGGVNLAYLIDSKGLHDLESLTKYLATLWVAPPTSEEYQEALTRTRKYSQVKEAKSPIEAEPAAKSTAKKPKTSKASTSKKASDENPEELWEDAEAAAYQGKKTTTRKPSTRKTTTRKTSTRKSTAKKKST